MSRDFRHGFKSLNRKTDRSKPKIDDRAFHAPSKQKMKTVLQHAVRRRDTDALEDYDEWVSNK